MGDDRSETNGDGEEGGITYENEHVKFEEQRATIRIHLDEAVAAVRGRLRDGSLAFFGGIVILYRAARTARRNRSRAVIQALIGTCLVAFGQRQRRFVGGESGGGRGDEKATTNPVNEGRQPEIDVEEMVEDEPETEDE